MIVVLDASAIGSFLLPDEDAELGRFARETCRTAQLLVPPVWRSELAALLWKAFRRGRIDAEKLRIAAADADVVAAVVHTEAEPSVAELIGGCRRTGLKPYDFTYFDIARRLDLPLLTADGPLRRAALQHGLSLLLP